MYEQNGKVKNAPLRVLSVQEQQILIANLAEELDFTELGIYICLFTGIRVGELCALTWDDISLENNMIHIHRTMQRIQTPDSEKKTEILIAEPKSQCSIRDIPIESSLREKLIQQAVKEGYVLTGNKNKYVEPRTMQNVSKQSWNDAVFGMPISIHFATLLLPGASRLVLT